VQEDVIVVLQTPTKGHKVKATEITWTRVNNGLRIEYIGSNGIVITRRGITSKLYSGRDRQGGNKGYYYEVSGLGRYTRLETLKDAKAAAENPEPRSRSIFSSKN